MKQLRILLGLLGLVKGIKVVLTDDQKTTCISRTHGLMCIPGADTPELVPGVVPENQIDFIMVSNRFRNWIHKVKTFPAADLKIDYNPVVAVIKLNVRKISNPRVMAKFLPEPFIVPETGCNFQQNVKD